MRGNGTGRITEGRGCGGIFYFRMESSKILEREHIKGIYTIWERQGGTRRYNPPPKILAKPRARIRLSRCAAMPGGGATRAPATSAARFNYTLQTHDMSKSYTSYRLCHLLKVSSHALSYRVRLGNSVVCPHAKGLYSLSDLSTFSAFPTVATTHCLSFSFPISRLTESRCLGRMLYTEKNIRQVHWLYSDWTKCVTKLQWVYEL